MQTRTPVLPRVTVILTAVAFFHAGLTGAAVEVGISYHHDVSPAVRDVADKSYETSEPEKNSQPLPYASEPAQSATNSFGVLRLLAPEAIPPPSLNLDGIVSDAAPPSDNGAAGLTQYVQVVANSYQVFDKASGATVLGPASLGLLWDGFAGPCQNDRWGDAVVLYDHIANRWFVSQLAGEAAVTRDVCIAVSTTSDATGNYYRYSFHLSSNVLTDNRFGAWPDGYYMSANAFNSSGTTYLGPQAFAFDRAKMLAGLSASFVTLGITSGQNEPRFLPSDLDGDAPPFGTPNPFVSFPGTGIYYVRLFHADFASPNNSTFTLIDSPVAAPFTPVCGGADTCVPQGFPKTPIGLQAHGKELMPRLAYRYFSDHESIVGNYTVDANNVAGIRWFELRHVTTSPVALFQESTYQPDTTWRWTGSAAMDRSGNLALGFSASSNSINPQIRYTGRLASDPPNALPQGEQHLFDGPASQNNPYWGPASSMTVDPVDDCTFWYTNEYVGTDWVFPRTRIGNFRFAECVSAPSPTPTATPELTATPTPSPTPKITATPTPTASATPTATPFSIVVTTLGDAGPGSLRQAIADASDGDIILFDPALNGQTIEPSSQLVIDKSISIIGPGSGLLTFSRSGFSDRFFYIAPGHNVSLTGLTMRNALVSNDPVGGAAIFNDQSSLTLNDCVVTENRCVCERGAGIYNGGKNATLTIINSVISHNQGSENGGGIYNGGTLIVRQSVIDTNWTGRGAGIFSAGNMDITDSTIRGNRASGGGGGITNTGSSTITNTTINDNFAVSRGGGIENNGPLTIINSTISENGRAFKVSPDPGNGGGVYNADAAVTITHTTISDNICGSSGLGGGIYLASGTLQIDQTILNRGTTGANIASDSGTITSNGYNLSSDDGGGFLHGPGDLVDTNPLLGPRQNNGGLTETYALLNESPAIDAGNPDFTPPPSHDQRGTGFVRVYNAHVDIGSFEAQPPAAQPAGMLNISTRLRIETDDGIMIGGFIIGGSEPKRVAIRGTGPSLSGSGVSDMLIDPALELRDSDGAVLAQNDNWLSNTSQAAELSSLGLALQNYFESGMVVTLQPGAYTALLTGKNRTTGVGLIEVYDINPTATSKLANLSTRGLVQTDSNVMIGGFLLGNGSSTYGLAVRGIGPSLAQAGLNNVLADPTLELRDSNGILLIANDNWEDDSVSAAQLVALGLAPQNSLESAIVTNLPNGAFTAILAGKDGGIGIGVVEFYDVPPQAETTPTPGPTSTP